MAVSCVAATVGGVAHSAPSCRAAAARCARVAAPRAALRLASAWCPRGTQQLLRVGGTRRRPSAPRRSPQASAASLVAPTDTWTVWAVLLSVSALGIWCVRCRCLCLQHDPARAELAGVRRAEKSTKLGAALSGPLVTTLAALALSNLGVLPTAAPAFSVVTGFLLPLAVPLLLFGSDLRRVVRDTGRLLGAFALGAIGTVGGTLVALVLFPMAHLGHDAWKMAAALCSRHIGGAVNYVAVSEFLGVTPSLVAAGLAADNLICALYFTSVFALAAGVTVGAAAPAPADGIVEDPESSTQGVSVATAAYALALSSAICALSVAGARALNVSGADIPIITAVVVLLATVFPGRVGSLAPAGSLLAAVLLQVFFAVVGAAGSVRDVIATAPALFLFSALQVALHLGFTLAAGKAAGYTRAELLLASNACVGGPTTAAGMATTKGWHQLLVPAILMGVLGYAVATFASIALGQTVLQALWLQRTAGA